MLIDCSSLCLFDAEAACGGRVCLLTGCIAFLLQALRLDSEDLAALSAMQLSRCAHCYVHCPLLLLCFDCDVHDVQDCPDTCSQELALEQGHCVLGSLLKQLHIGAG